MLPFRLLVVQLLTVIMLGAITTVALAWFAASWDWTTSTGAPVPFGMHNRGFGFAKSARVRTDLWWFAEADFYTSNPKRRTPPKWSRMWRLDTKDNGGVHWESASGWPMLAMLSECHWRSPTDTLIVSGFQIGSTPTIIDGSYGAYWLRLLPIKVIPMGFAVNTALAASLWWLLLFAVPTARHCIRVRRGTCLYCGYGPLASPNVDCPECGRVGGERCAKPE